MEFTERLNRRAPPMLGDVFHTCLFDWRWYLGLYLSLLNFSLSETFLKCWKNKFISPLQFKVRITRYDVERGLIDTLFTGLSICFPISFGVLLVASRNWIISVIAIFTILLIVGNVMGYFHYAQGFFI